MTESIKMKISELVDQVISESNKSNTAMTIRLENLQRERDTVQLRLNEQIVINEQLNKKMTAILELLKK